MSINKRKKSVALKFKTIVTTHTNARTHTNTHSLENHHTECEKARKLWDADIPFCREAH